jgi:hypothetical protein
MHYKSVIHGCIKPGGHREAEAGQVGDKIAVRCPDCGASTKYPVESLNRSSLALVQQQIGSRFKVDDRYRRQYAPSGAGSIVSDWVFPGKRWALPSQRPEN